MAAEAQLDAERAAKEQAEEDLELDMKAAREHLATLEAQLAALHAEREGLKAQRQTNCREIAAKHFEDVLHAEDENTGCLVSTDMGVPIFFACQWNQRPLCAECAALQRRIEDYAISCMKEAQREAVPPAVETLLKRWEEAADVANELVVKYQMQDDDAGNAHAFLKERRIWRTCAAELRALFKWEATPPPVGLPSIEQE